MVHYRSRSFIIFVYTIIILILIFNSNHLNQIYKSDTKRYIFVFQESIHHFMVILNLFLLVLY